MEKDGLATNDFGPARARKQMRKGTHSCAECRRRKIRCTFARNALVCTPCSSRGSRCVDQQHESFAAHSGSEASGPGSTESRELLRNPTPSTVLDDASDSDIVLNEKSNPVPLVSVIADSERWSTGARPATNHSSGSQENHILASSNPSQFSQRKAEGVCKALRSALPGYDSIISTLADNASWWDGFRFKTHMNAREPAEDLASFAARTYTCNSPALLGSLAAAYARSSNQSHHLYYLVESLVISDFDYVSSLDGMQCLMLVAKSLTDIGQPRRSWLIWRRGIAIAQLMGLYRGDSNHVLADNIWWAVFHGDRFTSLLLGVPHGCSDSYYLSKANKDQTPQAQAVLQTVIIAGKITERNMMPGAPSVAETLSLDEQLDAAAALLPEDWWDIPKDVTLGTELKEKVLQQYYFFFVKTHLHLPFMAKSSTKVTASVISKLACIEASRQILKRFLILRTVINGHCVFECKTTAFLAFMAAVILIIGRDELGHMPTLSASRDDMSLLAATRDLFRETLNKEGCKISSQCSDTLDKLMGSYWSTSTATGPHAESDKIHIPYFGIVVRRRGPQTQEPAPEQSQATAHINEGQSMPASQPAIATPRETNLQTEMWPHSFEYSGLINTGDGVAGQEDVGFNNLGDPGWPSTLMMDLDQDWGLFPTLCEA